GLAARAPARLPGMRRRVAIWTTKSRSSGLRVQRAPAAFLVAAAPETRVCLRCRRKTPYDQSPNNKGNRAVRHSGWTGAGVCGVTVLGLLLAGCAQTPLGPTVQVMPGPGKSF